MRRPHKWAVFLVAAALGVAACSGGSGRGSTTSGTEPFGEGAILSVDVVARAGAFQQPIDAAPTHDGKVVYFVATGSHGPAIFSVSAHGGAVSTVAEGAPLAKPTGVAVATDGSGVYIADQNAQTGGATGAPGAILAVSVPSTGAPGTAASLPSTQGYSPRGVDVDSYGDADVVYFTGTDPSNGKPGLFEVTAAGTVSSLAEGAPFATPDSVVVSAKGVAYVSDQGTGPGQGKIFSVSGGTITQLLTGLHLGAPAGLTLINHEGVLLVSSIDPATSSDQLLFLDLATGLTATTTKGIGANTNSSGGLHRAGAAAVLGWADIRGRVYVVGAEGLCPPQCPLPPKPRPRPRPKPQ